MADTQLESGTHNASIRTLRVEHRTILALFEVYLAISPDSRQATMDQILNLLEEHFLKEEALLAGRKRQPGNQADCQGGEPDERARHHEQLHQPGPEPGHAADAQVTPGQEAEQSDDQGSQNTC